MNKIIFRLLMCISLVFMYSCMSHDEKINCVEKLINENKNHEVSAILEDSIYSWSNQKLKFMSRYAPEFTTWEIDALFFNSTSDRLFGWILKIDNDVKVNSLDYVEFYCGEKRGNKWFFYLHNMPSVWGVREHNDNMKYTFEQLSTIAKEQVIRGGLINSDGKLNDSYINEWVDRDGRDLYEWHKDFLKSGTR